MQLTHTLVRLFRHQRGKVVAKAHAILPKHFKIWQRLKDKKNDTPELRKDRADEIADELYEAIMEEWDTLPDSAREDLLAAATSGAGKGAVQLKIHDVELISAINQTAKDWADHRAAELVGMRYTKDGDLIPNPNAQWTISEATRGELRRIIASAFEKETPLSSLIEDIQNAGAFSAERAALIATTEVQFAQAHGNYAAWEESGLVVSVTSILSEDHEIEDDCDENDGVVVKLGEPFPSGHIAPPYHPRCECILATAELAGDEEEG